MEIRGTTSNPHHHHPTRDLVSTTMTTAIHQAYPVAYPQEVRARLNRETKTIRSLMNDALPATLKHPNKQEERQPIKQFGYIRSYGVSIHTQPEPPCGI
jgi:hypothetical protein